MLRPRFALDERRRGRRARLQYHKLMFDARRERAHAAANAALVLVAPDDEVDAAGQLCLADVPLGIHAGATWQPVLVQRQDGEPLVALLDRTRHLDVLALEAAREPLVAHVADAVQRELRRTFADQHRRERDLLKVARAPKVVDQVGRRENVERGKAAVAGRVVVVAMDGEDGQLHVVVRVFEVHRLVLAMEVGLLVGHDLNLHLPAPETVVTQDLHALVHRAARGLVVVEEVACEQHHVHLLAIRDLEDLGERDKGVVAADGVLFAIPEMCVGGDQNAEDVVFGGHRRSVVGRARCCEREREGSANLAVNTRPPSNYPL